MIKYVFDREVKIDLRWLPRFCSSEIRFHFSVIKLEAAENS